MYILFTVIVIILWPLFVWANCITLDLSALNEEQRKVVPHTVAGLIGSGTTVKPTTGTSVEICHATLSVSGLTAVSIQNAAQAHLTAKSNAIAAEEAEITALKAELAANDACNVNSLQEAINKITAQKADIQVDIDAVTNITTAKTALTTANNRLTAIDTNIVKCMFTIIKLIRKGLL